MLGLKTKAEILALGIEKFNEACRASVLQVHRRVAGSYVTRQARWVDFDNDYKTLDRDYMESVIWAFKTLVRQGPGVRGPAGAAVLLERRDPAVATTSCGWTTTSTSRARTRSVTVAVRAGDRASGCWPGRRRRGRCRATWRWRSGRTSTTWWSSDAEGRPTILRGGRGWPRTPREFGDRRRGTEVAPAAEGRGADRAALHAAVRLPRRHRAVGDRNAFQVIAAEHVTTEEGTGVVHMAPAYGEEDQMACDAVGIPTLLTVDDGARFTSRGAAVPGSACVRGEPADHPRPAGGRRRWCARRATCTATRTAGGAGTR